MKKITVLTVALFYISLLSFSQNYDYLSSATNSATAVSPANNTYGYVVSVSIDLGATTGNITELMILSGMNMKKSGSSTSGREIWYNITNDANSNESGEINRQVQAIDTDDYGIGTLVHIFDVSGLSGTVTYTLEQKQTKPGPNRDVETTAYLTAIALTTETYGNSLNNSVKRIDGAVVSTNSSSFVPVTGLLSDAVNLPMNGDIYVAASVNTKRIAGTSGIVGEWELQYQADGAGSWTSLGKPVTRTMSNTADDGIISLVGIVDDLATDDYLFRVAHRVITGTGSIVTHNTNLVVVALAHSGGGYFPSFSAEIGSTGVSIVGESTSGNLTSVGFTSLEDIGAVGPSLLVHAQYVGVPTNLNQGINERLLAEHQLLLDDGVNTPEEAIAFKRLLANNSDYGSGGFIGLAQDLDPLTSYTLDMDHTIFDVYNQASPDDETLKTFDVILCGFQTYDKIGFIWNGETSSVWETDANWAFDVAPSASTDIIIIPDVTIDPIIGSTVTASCNDIYIRSGASLTLNPGAQLTVNVTLANDGDLNLESDATGVSSLLHNTNTISANVECYLSEDQWHGVASPLTDGLSGSFYNTYLKYYNEFDSSWTYIIPSNISLTPGKGFFAWDYDNVVIPYSGTLNNGDVSPALVYTSAATHGGQGWNLIGNPFPSTLEYDGSWSTSNVDATIYLYNGSQYVTWNGSLGTHGSGNIAPGQAFWVHANTTSPTVIIPQNKRKHSSQAFYKDGSSNEFTLFVNGNENSDQVYIVFNQEATLGFDANLDAYKLNGAVAAPQLFMKIGADQLAVNYIPKVESQVIPLSLNVGEEGIYTFELGNDNFDTYSNVYLEDLLTSELVDLKQAESYSFTAAPGDMEDRFVLHFSMISSVEDITQSGFVIYSSGSEIYFKSDRPRSGMVSVFDLAGRKVMDFNLDVINSEKIQLELNRGFYVLSYFTQKETFTAKVFIE